MFKYLMFVIFFSLPFSLHASSYSIEATFYWPDGAEETAIVYSYLNKKKHWQGERGYYFDTGLYKNDLDNIPWNKIKRIELAPFQKKSDSPNTRITLVNGSIKKGFDYDVKTTVNWQGIKAKFLKWNKLEARKIKYAPPPPSDTMTSCDGAGGCTGPGIADGGIWKFIADNDKSYLITLVTGGFGITRSTGGIDADGNYVPVGIWPANTFVSKYKTENIVIDTAPRATLRKVHFLLDMPENPIIFEFLNGKQGMPQYTEQELQDLSDNGLLGWSYFGLYQVRTIIRYSNLQTMELTKSSAFKKLKSQFKTATLPQVKWKITLKNGQTITTSEIEGYQKQLIPIAPPKGKYWRVRPDREIGVAGGKYLIVQHSSGYHIIPLNIVKEIIPDKLSITLRTDASGKQFNFSRFHPGNSWVNNGLSGRNYFDDTADEKVDIKKLTNLKYKKNGAFKEIPFTEIEKIMQL